MDIIYKPIGIIHTPFHSLDNMPIQPASNKSSSGVVEIFRQYVDGLKDLAGFSHIYLLCHLHKVQQARLTVTPFLDDQPRGVFATRAPSRPNPIGLSLVELVRVEENLVYVNHVDMLDKTPLLDIKPFVPEFDDLQDIRLGWLEKARGQVRNQQSDSRFI